MKNNAMAVGVRVRIICGALAIMTIILSMGENTMAQTKSTAVVRRTSFSSTAAWWTGPAGRASTMS
jgi:hypothetical protein